MSLITKNLRSVSSRLIFGLISGWKTLEVVRQGAHLAAEENQAVRIDQSQPLPIEDVGRRVSQIRFLITLRSAKLTARSTKAPLRTVIKESPLSWPSIPRRQSQYRHEISWRRTPTKTGQDGCQSCQRMRHSGRDFRLRGQRIMKNRVEEALEAPVQRQRPF